MYTKLLYLPRGLECFSSLACASSSRVEERGTKFELNRLTWFSLSKCSVSRLCVPNSVGKGAALVDATKFVLNLRRSMSPSVSSSSHLWAAVFHAESALFDVTYVQCCIFTHTMVIKRRPAVFYLGTEVSSHSIGHTCIQDMYMNAWHCTTHATRKSLIQVRCKHLKLSNHSNMVKGTEQDKPSRRQTEGPQKKWHTINHEIFVLEIFCAVNFRVE